MRLIVVGSGIAGLLSAIEARRGGHDVTVVTKGGWREGSTAWAQGGVAVVGPSPDTIVAHVADTRAAGAGLSDPDAAMALCAEGPRAIDTLLEHGVPFDREDGVLARALEAAHRYPRVLHAGGDATGAAIIDALWLAVGEERIAVREHTTAIDLLVDRGRCVGVRVLGPQGPALLHADAVVLATGGAGQLYPMTSNPAVATADGVALALRAGAQVADLEMLQFHPTVLACDAPFLVSEAMRGEGAVLLDHTGRRFMLDVHPAAELAPRDVVARAIAEQCAAQGSPVLLDAGPIGVSQVAQRFPTVAAACAERGFDLLASPVPVTPAAHYWMGGVRTDLRGRTSVPGLWAVGEAACTGVHGANRLASNSLLEGAVFGLRAARSLAEPWPEHGRADGWDVVQTVDLGDAAAAGPWRRSELQEAMWRGAGLARDAEGLAALAVALHYWATPSPHDARSAEDRNLLLAARALVASALARPASLGAHHRSDHPKVELGGHTVLAASVVPGGGAGQAVGAVAGAGTGPGATGAPVGAGS